MSQQSGLFGDGGLQEPQKVSGSNDSFGNKAYQPLAEKMRPHNLQEMVGQSHLIGNQGPLQALYHRGEIHSMILWGPPGTGKTTLARILASHDKISAHWITLSAVMSGVKEIREAIEHAKIYRQQGKLTVLFVDEVHRFNKSQQDAFLPHIEDGTIVFIGATTENPSFELNSALLSRSKVYVLQDVSVAEIEVLLQRAMKAHFPTISLDDPDVLTIIAKSSGGDVRKALNVLESSVQLSENSALSKSHLEKSLGTNLARYDKNGDVFYQQISAFHKSLRGSDPDAALYWMARMLDGGCDPFYIIRRLVCVASEDIGNADPKALTIALNAWDAFLRLGAKEGQLALAHATVYLASVPKSNAVYVALKRAKRLAAETSSMDVPLHLRNASTSLLKDMNYGAEYHYSHEGDDAFSEQQTYFPDELISQSKDDPQLTHFYEPTDRGLEKRLSQWLSYLKSKRDC